MHPVPPFLFTRNLGVPFFGLSDYNVHKWYVISVITVPSLLYLERNVYFMELIVISHTKIKIMLSKPDMARYELTSSHMDFADEHTRCSVRRILADAEKQIGFDTEGERLFVQFFASRDGGCEIFVTKLGKNTDVCQSTEKSEEHLLARVREYESDDTHYETEESMPLIRSTTPLTSSRTNTESIHPAENSSATVFVEQLSILLSLCRRLLNAGFSGCSDAYMHESANGFYLRINEDNGENLVCIYPFIGEYGAILSNVNWDLYIDEHAKLLCPLCAVQTLGVL